MLINLAPSNDDSMSGISTESKSTRGSNVQWEDNTQGRERTVESIQMSQSEKIILSCAKYDQKPDEINNWIKSNTPKGKEERLQRNIEELQEMLEYSIWKTLIVDIKNA